MKSIQMYEIVSNENIATDIYKMVLKGDSSWVKRPGQFVNITIENAYLKRPISICDWDENSITIIYKVVGKGTEAMAEMKAGETLDILTGLGNGYDLTKSGDAPLLIGGGAGVPPMYYLCKLLCAEGKKPTVSARYR